jgi:excisionase family DNA binding protein
MGKPEPEQEGRTVPRTKPTHQTKTSGGANAAPAANLANHEVLTLAEAAAFLRVPEEEVLRLVGPGGLPGRLIGSEWRFSKAAILEWLRTPPPKSSKEAFLALAGAWKDDPDLDKIVREAYRQRGRPITEEGE